jgi:hypothetical protein
MKNKTKSEILKGIEDKLTAQIGKLESACTISREQHKLMSAACFDERAEGIREALKIVREQFK